MLLMRNLRRRGTRKFRDRFIGPFALTQCTGKTAHRLDGSSHAALRGMHNMFHVLLLRDWHSNGVHADMPPIEIDGEAEYEILSIKRHRERNGKL